MVIYVDCDGVLGDWVKQVHLWADKPLKPWKAWDGFSENGITQAQIDDMMSFVSFWDSMELLPGAKKLWAEVGKLADSVYVCTRPFPDPNCLYGRAVWLERELDIEIRQTIYMHDKYELARPGAILIDDNVDNCRLFEAKGGRAILYPQSYNSTIEIKDKTQYILGSIKILMELQDA
jgi:5'(3')-deoxyribonucleotidase